MVLVFIFLLIGMLIPSIMREYHSDFKGSIPSSPLFEVLITSDDGISDQDAIKVAKHSFKPKYSQKI
jgi:hypothetical protein